MKGGTGNFGLTAMAGFLLFGATMEALAGITLLFPSGFLDPIWRLNPAAGEQLRRGRDCVWGVNGGDDRRRDRVDEAPVLGLGAGGNYCCQSGAR